MKKESLSSQSTGGDLAASWQRVVRRRSFLRGIGLAGAAALPSGKAFAETASLSPGDAALLRFAAWAEIVETDLWTQYNELGGVNGGNKAYMAALENIDSDMPQYVADNTDDEVTHADFLNAYLVSRGADPVNLDQFRTLPSSKATGAKQIGRLTNLMNLNVDLSWYTRYRSSLNPDLGATFTGPFTIIGEPSIPLDDVDTPPNQDQPVPPANAKQSRMQAIANTAAFHFAFIEQGGSSLYPTLAFKASDPEVLRVLISIGGVEIDHFSLWHDKAGNAVSEPLAGVKDPRTGVTFPNLNNPPTELTQTNLVLPEPCDFISTKLPKCSVIRPTSTQLAGAVATVRAFTDNLLLQGQSPAFFALAMQLATAADSVVRAADPAFTPGFM